MRLDLNKYIVNRSIIQDLHIKSIDKNAERLVSIFACSSHCPCVALLFYLAEQDGYTPELVGLIDMFIKFYGYTQIVGQLGDSPFLYLEDKK